MSKREPKKQSSDPEFLVVGQVLGQCGVQGEIKTRVLTDFPDRFDPGMQLYVDGHPLTIERSHPHKEHLILKFSNIDNVDAASRLRGKDLEIPLSQAHPLPDGEYYRFQILGLEVVSSEGESVGKVAEILPTGSNDVYVVPGPFGEVLVPAIDDVVKSIDLERGRMIIDIIDGLI